MGCGSRLAALVVGLASFGVGLWLVGALCFFCLAFSFRPVRRRSSEGKVRRGIRVAPRLIVTGVLLSVSAVAFISGGVFSPMVFFIAAVVVLLWPGLVGLLPFSEALPVKNSILLRSKYLPFSWSSLAELKPGTEAFPRAVSSFTGTLLVFTNTGKTYAVASCRSLEQKEAEANVLLQFRRSTSGTGAYLLPLDAEVASDVLRLNLLRSKIPSTDLAESASGISGILMLDCNRGTIRRAATFDVLGTSSSATVPPRGSEVESAPLTWEVFDSLSKRTRWPEADAYSNLLDSMVATRGVPIAERVRGVEGSGNRVTVHSLSGEEVCVSRPQLRAIFSIYS